MNFKTTTKGILPNVSDEAQGKFNKQFREDVSNDLQSLANYEDTQRGHLIYMSSKRWTGSAWIARKVYHTSDSGWATKNEDDWFDDYTIPGYVVADATNAGTSPAKAPAALCTISGGVCTDNVLILVKRYMKEESR